MMIKKWLKNLQKEQQAATKKVQIVLTIKRKRQSKRKILQIIGSRKPQSKKLVPKNKWKLKQKKRRKRRKKTMDLLTPTIVLAGLDDVAVF